MKILPAIGLIAAMSYPAIAAPPVVATDIEPVQALVSQVMAGVGVPVVLVGKGAAPHDFSLRPSQARLLAAADVIFMVGAELTPWLNQALPSLAPTAIAFELLQVPETTLLAFRDGPVFSSMTEYAGLDPHAWLDPENAKIWLGAIAVELSRLDPDNANKYQQNARQGQVAISAAAQQVETILAPFRGTQFISYHDAFQYFEARFNIWALASISDSEASAPGAARISELSNLIRQNQVACIFVEPGANLALAETVIGQSHVAIIEIDPFGYFLENPTYPKLLLDLAQRIVSCK